MSSSLGRGGRGGLNQTLDNIHCLYVRNIICHLQISPHETSAGVQERLLTSEVSQNSVSDMLLCGVMDRPARLPQMILCEKH